MTIVATSRPIQMSTATGMTTRAWACKTRRNRLHAAKTGVFGPGKGATRVHVSLPADRYPAGLTARWQTITTIGAGRPCGLQCARG